MCSNFGGHAHGLSNFAPFHFPSNFAFGAWTVVHGGQKIELAQKIHANRG